MHEQERTRQELQSAIAELPVAGPYFIEQRLARIRGPFLRAVKDVAPGESWWEIRYFFTLNDLQWAYLPEQHRTAEFAWGHTPEQAYLNGILLHVERAEVD
jgi:hypothetical protein